MMRRALLLSFLISVAACSDGPVAVATGDGGGGAAGIDGNGGAAGTGGDGGASGAGGGAGEAGAGGSPDRCGNGVIDGNEACDGSVLGDATCETEGFDGGTIACTSACELDASDCFRSERCDNGEDDDGDGDVDCDDTDCSLACPHCGDGVINADGEECDGAAVTVTCAELGHSMGNVRCTEACTLDASRCRDPEDCASPGDEDKNGLADCDDPACAADWSCPACGNWTVQQGEACDGNAPGSCTDFGFDAGVALCGHDCQAELSGCRNFACGDGFVDGDERCDDGNTVSGDGCDASCEIEGDRCTSPVALTWDANAGVWSWDGTTLGMFADYPAGCTDTVGVGDAVASFTAPSDGSYYVLLSAAFDGVLFGWQGGCGVGSPSACIDDAGAGAGEGIQLEIQAGDTAYFVVTGESVAEGGGANVGPFRLTAREVSCGDGRIEGWEQCEDGNALDGDGCSALCRWEGDTCADAFDLNALGLVPADAGWHWEPGTWLWAANTQRFAGDYTPNGPCDPAAGRDGVAQFVIPATGYYSYTLWSKFDASLHMMVNACNATAPAAGCIPTWIYSGPAAPDDPLYLIVATGPAQAGDFLYVVADGLGATDDNFGDFWLEVRPETCGDGIKGFLEGCDDGNFLSGDGCSATCVFEGVLESEPNDTIADADSVGPDSRATGVLPIGRSVDVDFWSFQAVAGTTYEIVTSTDLNGACDGAPDTYLRLFDSAHALLTENDAISATNNCSRLTWIAPASGTYFLEVGANAPAPATTRSSPLRWAWTYILTVEGS